MAILNPDDLIRQARELAATKPGQRGPPLQVNLRRAMSSAYYAVFHELLAAVADQFVGAALRCSERYALVYRSINHGQIRELCEEVRKTAPSRKYRPFVPSAGVSQQLQDFGRDFVFLQEERHKADYDPRPRPATADVLAIIGRAEGALAAYRALARTERELFLTLLAFPPR